MTTPPLLERVGPAAACAYSAFDRDAWECRGAELGRAASDNAWALGDWILQGEMTWGDVYTDALRVTDLAYKTLRNLRYVASRFELSRRRDKLKWAHHAELSGLSPAEADALLDRAEAESLSAAALRELATRTRPVPPLASRSEVVALLLRDAVGERQRLAQLPGADKVRIAHERYILELEALVDHLARLAAEPEFNPEDDKAYPEDLKGGRYGRRV